MKKLLFITILALVAFVSCSKKETGTAIPSGKITVGFRTGDVSTKAGDGNVADGGGIAFDNGLPDLIILVADSRGELVRKYPENGILQQGATPTEMAVTFTGLDEGTYMVYAFANTLGLWDMASGGSDVSNITSLTSASQLQALQFKPVSGSTARVLRNGRLPLSAEGQASVSEQGNGEVSLEMIRCVAKVSLELENNTGESLELDGLDFSIKGINPDRGYVLPIYLPDIPSGTVYGILDGTPGDDIVIEDGSSVTFGYLVFPGEAPDSRYLMDVEFTANSAAAPSRFTDLPVHDDHGVNIASLERNNHLHIVTKISKGNVSFNFETAEWAEKTEEVVFD